SSPYHSSGPTPSTGNPVTPELLFNTIGTIAKVIEGSRDLRLGKYRSEIPLVIRAGFGSSALLVNKDRHPSRYSSSDN
ncbi:hypothetical protein J6590_093501, partial [Homalodisca vitripennis]